jgi:hypothetical protein
VFALAPELQHAGYELEKGDDAEGEMCAVAPDPR